MPRRQSSVPGMASAALLTLLLASTALGQETIVSARLVGITDGGAIKALVLDNELLPPRKRISIQQISNLQQHQGK